MVDLAAGAGRINAAAEPVNWSRFHLERVIFRQKRLPDIVSRCDRCAFCSVSGGSLPGVEVQLPGPICRLYATKRSGQYADDRQDGKQHDIERYLTLTRLTLVR